MEKERIEAVLYTRSQLTASVARQSVTTKPPTPSGRWVLVERFATPQLIGLTQLPDGDLLSIVEGKLARSGDGGRYWQPVEENMLPAPNGMLGALPSGRWLLAHLVEPPPEEEMKYESVGLRNGYPIWKVSNAAFTRYTVVFYSDDQGKTWHGGDQPIAAPLKNSVPEGHFIRCDDGTVCLPVYGCLEGDVDSYTCSTGIVSFPRRRADLGRVLDHRQPRAQAG